jgi:hypothetical protein
VGRCSDRDTDLTGVADVVGYELVPIAGSTTDVLDHGEPLSERPAEPA